MKANEIKAKELVERIERKEAYCWTFIKREELPWGDIEYHLFKSFSEEIEEDYDVKYQERLLTYDEVMRTALEHYEHGGDSTFECTDRNDMLREIEIMQDIVSVPWYTMTSLLESFEYQLSLRGRY